MAVPSIIYNKTEEINSVSINIHLVPPKHPAVVHQLIFLLLLQVLLVLEVIMLRRSGAQTRRCWLEIQQSRYLSSAPAPPELRRLHYPASSRSRQGQAGQESGQLSLAQINRILKVRQVQHSEVLLLVPSHCSFLTRPTNTATSCPEAPPPMECWVSIATHFPLTIPVRIDGAAPPACWVGAGFCLVCLTAMQVRHVLRPSARGSSTTSLWPCCH